MLEGNDREMSKTVSSSLNALIETLKDGELGFRTAATDAKRSDLETLFTEYSTQRSQYRTELQQEVEKLGAAAEDSGSVAGNLHRGWINLKAAISSREDLAILEECERGEDSAVESYHEALAGDLGSARQIVQHQFTQIQAAHDKVRNLRDSLKSSNN